MGRSIFINMCKEVVFIGIKARNLYSMMNRGFNIHTFIEIKPASVEGLIKTLEDYYSAHKFFSVRTDSFSLNNKDLPFLFVDGDLHEKMDEIHIFAERVITLGLSCILASAREFDKYLIANIVVTFEGDVVMLEFSTRDVPLREMYKYPAELSSFVGSIFSKVSDFKRYGAVSQLEDEVLEKIIEQVFSKCKPGENYFELSLYSTKVGILQDNIVFWHIS